MKQEEYERMTRLSRKWLKSIRKKLRKSSHSCRTTDDIVYSSYTVPNCANQQQLIIYDQDVDEQPPQNDDEQVVDQRFKWKLQDDDAVILAAAIKIQATFRAHLARRAFKALRSLVKLQALARGAYVRKQTQLALHCMHALVRLQVRVRARQLLGSFDAS